MEGSRQVVGNAFSRSASRTSVAHLINARSHPPTRVSRSTLTHWGRVTAGVTADRVAADQRDDVDAPAPAMAHQFTAQQLRKLRKTSTHVRGHASGRSGGQSGMVEWLNSQMA